MADLKVAKDSLVSSLFELSKVAQDTANAAINYYNLDKSEGIIGNETSEGLRNISEVLKSIVVASQQVDAIASGSKLPTSKDGTLEKPKKKKVDRDPNAPKKPLTIYFQFSFESRKAISEERKRKNLPSLSAIDMNEIIREKWANISPEEKAKWQRKYAAELKEYQKAKELYKHTDNAAAYAIANGKALPPPTAAAVAKKATELQPHIASDSDSDSDSDDSSDDSSIDHHIKQISEESEESEPEPQPEIKKKEKKRKSDKDRKESKKSKKDRSDRS